jgi:hypothetical protein
MTTGKERIINHDCHRLAVDQKRPRPQRSRRLRYHRKPAGPVVPVAGEKPHAGGVAPHHHAKAVELDFVDPAGAGRWAISERWEAGLNKRRYTHLPGFLGHRPTPSSRALVEHAAVAQMAARLIAEKDRSMSRGSSRPSSLSM